MDLRRHAVTLLLVALAAVLGVYVFVIDRGSVTTAETDARRRNLLPVFRRDDISEVRIESIAPFPAAAGADGGAPASAPFVPFSLVLVRGADGEFELAPEGARDAGLANGGAASADRERADTAAVRKLLTALEFATPERAVGAGLDRHAMGLDSPRLRARIAMGRITYELAIGNAAPVPKGAAYGELRSTGIAVGGWFVLSHDVLDALSQPRDAYRDRALLTVDLGELETIELSGSGGDRTLVRRPWGWGLEVKGRAGAEARVLRADRENAESIVTALGELRADGFPAKDAGKPTASPAPPGGALAERVHVALSAKGGKAVAFEIGGDCPGRPGSVLVVRAAPARTACVPLGLMPSLSLGAESLFDRRLFAARSDEMESIEITSPEGRLDLARKGSGWHLRAPDDRPLDADAGNALAGWLAAAAAEPDASWADIVEGPTGAPAAVESAGGSAFPTRVRIGTVGGAEPADGGTAGVDQDEIVDIGPTGPGGSTWVRRRQDGAFLRVGRRIAASLTPSPIHVRSLQVLGIDESTIERIEARMDGERAAPAEILARGAGGEWRLASPQGFAIDGETAHDMADTLARLRARRWVAERDDGSFGFGPDRGGVVARLREGGQAATREFRLELGSAAQDGVYARVAGDPAVFVLDGSTARALGAWAIDRSLVPSPLRDSTPITIDRRGEPPRRVQLSAALESALEGLHADEAIHPGGPRPGEGFDAPELALTLDLAPPGDAGAAGGRGRHLVLRFGAAAERYGQKVRYVRRSDVDATFVLGQRAFDDLAAALADAG